MASILTSTCIKYQHPNLLDHHHHHHHPNPHHHHHHPSEHEQNGKNTFGSYILNCLLLPLHIIVLTINTGCADRGGWLLGDPPVAVCKDDPSDPPLPLVSKCQVPLQPFFPRPMKNKDGYTTWACGYFSQVMTTTMMTIAKMTTVATMIMKMS